MKISRRQFLTGCAAAAFIPKQLWTGAASASASLSIACIHARAWTGLSGAAIGSAGSHIARLDDAQVRARIGKRTQIIDLQGAVGMPGFIDNPPHFMHAGTSLSPPDLRNARTRTEFARRAADTANRLPSDRRMRDGSWDAMLCGGELPTRAWSHAAPLAGSVLRTIVDGKQRFAAASA